MSEAWVPSNPVEPVRYVLYSHYGYQEREDGERYRGRTAVADLEGIRHLRQYLHGLRELLTTPGHEGMLVLFYAAGLLKSLHEDSIALDRDGLLRDHDLAFANEFAEYVRKELHQAGMGGRVRFITPLDIWQFLKDVNKEFARDFLRFMVGRETPEYRYDTPKIPEAILRLRILGHGIPVLRLDHDVLFNDDNREPGDLGLFKAIACAVKAYGLRLEAPNVATFVFSASYNTRALVDPSYSRKPKDPFVAWSEAFATRIHPALVANETDIRHIQDMPTEEERNREWRAYAERYLDAGLARAYYGLLPFRPASDPKVGGDKGLTGIGAHPMFSVISGALLCLSEGAILDLPPFSNFRYNVSWIDDHLKYCLHREMGHFTGEERLTLAAPGLSDARFDKVMVNKGRPSVNNLPGYTFAEYLPTLLLGAIMDAWITPFPIVKRRLSSLTTKNERDEWHKHRRGPSQGILPKALLEALRVGDFRLRRDAKEELKQALGLSAIERVEKVRQTWGALKRGSTRTFASYWATGEVAGAFPETCFEGYRDDIWRGIAPGRCFNDPLRSMQDIGPQSLRDRIGLLIDDALTYVEWTLKWPQFVQIVRSAPQGTFVGDVSWPRAGFRPSDKPEAGQTT